MKLFRLRRGETFVPPSRKISMRSTRNWGWIGSPLRWTLTSVVGQRRRAMTSPIEASFPKRSARLTRTRTRHHDGVSAAAHRATNSRAPLDPVVHGNRPRVDDGKLRFRRACDYSQRAPGAYIPTTTAYVPRAVAEPSERDQAGPEGDQWSRALRRRFRLTCVGQPQHGCMGSQIHERRAVCLLLPKLRE